jgi:hypothetical protein
VFVVVVSGGPVAAGAWRPRWLAGGGCVERGVDDFVAAAAGPQVLVVDRDVELLARVRELLEQPGSPDAFGGGVLAPPLLSGASLRLLHHRFAGRACPA